MSSLATGAAAAAAVSSAGMMRLRPNATSAPTQNPVSRISMIARRTPMSAGEAFAGFGHRLFSALHARGDHVRRGRQAGWEACRRCLAALQGEAAAISLPNQCSHHGEAAVPACMPACACSRCRPCLPPPCSPLRHHRDAQPKCQRAADDEAVAARERVAHHQDLDAAHDNGSKQEAGRPTQNTMWYG